MPWVAAAPSDPLVGVIVMSAWGDDLVSAVQMTASGPVLVSWSITLGVDWQATVTWVGEMVSQSVGGRGVAGTGVVVGAAVAAAYWPTGIGDATTTLLDMPLELESADCTVVTRRAATRISTTMLMGRPRTAAKTTRLPGPAGGNGLPESADRFWHAQWYSKSRLRQLISEQPAHWKAW